MASTSTTTRVRRSGRVRAFTGPRLRPSARRGRAAQGRPGGVAAPSIERPADLAGVLPVHEVTRTSIVRANPAAPAPVRTTSATRREPGVHLTERGMLAVLVVFGGLVAAAAAVIVVSFFRVSNAPLSGPRDAVGAAQSVAVAQAPGSTRS